MTGAHLWIPAFAGMTKKGQSHAAMGSRHSRKTLPIILAKHSSSFSQNTPRHSRKTLLVIPAKHSSSFPQNTPRHSRKTLPSSFPQNTPRHSRKTLPVILAKHSSSFPRRRESIGHHSDPHGGFFLESTESFMPEPISSGTSM